MKIDAQIIDGRTRLTSHERRIKKKMREHTTNHQPRH